MTTTNIRLSEHFALEEFLRSQVAARAGHALIPNPQVIANLTRLCVVVLEPLRARLGRPIAISSGYRDEWLNARVGGAPDSAHLTGRAADILIVGMTAEIASRWLARQGDIRFDKVIDEFHEWTHVQISPNTLTKPRGEFWLARHDGHQTTYTLGDPA